MGLKRGAFSAAVCAAVLLGVTVNAGAATPTATVKPARNLTDGATVTVSWSGFHPKPNQEAFISILQCNVNGGGTILQACANPVPVSPPKRKGTIKYTVHTGAIGNGTCGTSAQDRKCVIEVVGGTSSGLIRESTGAVIRFALP